MAAMQEYMAVYLTLTAVVLILARQVENHIYAGQKLTGNVPWGMERQEAKNMVAAGGIFVLLASVSACRIAVGNDYWVYRENFKLIYAGRDVASEPGFNFIVYWMQKLWGYDNYLPIFGLFSVVTAAFMVKALYDQSEWFFGSLFLLMTSGYYFSSLNSVRYYLVVAMVMYATKYLLREEYLKFILWICFAALFHKSVLLVIPAYLILYWLSKRKLRPWILAAGGALIVSMMLFQDFYRKIIFLFYPFYEESAYDTGSISIVNVGMGLCCLVLCFLCYGVWKDRNPHIRFYVWVNAAGLVINLFGSFIPEVTRVGNYFKVVQVFLIPALLYHLPEGKWKKLLTAGTAAAFLIYFAFFLKSAYDVDIRILPYRTWIFD
ncbi:MAG: EpsG family protein [Lachnospiraceae bacterium]|nr:EpsG family protein [Lachnospiraceae bacterium]